MGRRPRVEYEGALYHVVQRGNNREYIYLTPAHRNFMVEQLANAVEVDGVEVFAYVIMSNHYHLLLRTVSEPLHKVMHRINTRYAKWYNTDRDRSGPVFETRYKAIPIQDERYLLQLVRYIHRNPVRAKMCLHPQEYPWSSDSTYRGNVTGKQFVNNAFILNILAPKYQEALKDYNVLMETTDDENMEDVSFIGDASFALLAQPKVPVPARLPLDEILLGTGISLEEFRLIKSGSRRRSLQPYKKTYAQAAVAQGYTLEEIGSKISVSASAVGKCLGNEC